MDSIVEEQLFALHDVTSCNHGNKGSSLHKPTVGIRAVIDKVGNGRSQQLAFVCKRSQHGRKWVTRKINNKSIAIEELLCIPPRAKLVSFLDCVDQSRIWGVPIFIKQYNATPESNGCTHCNDVANSEKYATSVRTSFHLTKAWVATSLHATSLHATSLHAVRLEERRKKRV